MTFNLQAAESFLLRNFDPSLNLIREAPNAAPTNFWAFNDNVAAIQALQDNFLVAGQIQATVDSYKLFPTRISVLNGVTIPWNLFLLPVKIVQLAKVGSKNILTEQLDTSQQPNMQLPTQYADIAFYYALNQWNMGDYAGALSTVQKLEQAKNTQPIYWNGLGWVDKAYDPRTGLLATYKAALYLIVCNQLAYEGALRAQNENVVIRSQIFGRTGFANQQGGTFTEYSTTGYTGDANCESTALCKLAFQNRL